MASSGRRPGQQVEPDPRPPGATERSPEPPSSRAREEDAGSSESGSRDGAGARSPRSILRRREEGRQGPGPRLPGPGRARLARSQPSPQPRSPRARHPPGCVRGSSAAVLVRGRSLRRAFPSRRFPPGSPGGGKERRERTGGTARKGRWRWGPRFAHRLVRRRSPSPASQQQQPLRPPPPASPALRLGAGKRT